jgi:hypothetical protein
MAFKNKQKESKKPTTLAEYKAQGWEVGPLVGMSNPPVYTLTKDGKTIKFRPKMKIQPPIKRPPKNPKPEAKPMKDGGKVTGRSIGPAGASIVSNDGKRIKQLKKAGKSGLKTLAGRLASRGYGKARR